MSTRSLGAAGEESAAQYLIKNGYTILARNLYIGHREIDILAKSETHLLFIEVKTRRQYPGIPDRYGRPADQVTPKKRESLRAAARAFLRYHAGEYAALTPNIDIIEVYLCPGADSGYRVLDIRHFRNAVNGSSTK